MITLSPKLSIFCYQQNNDPSHADNGQSKVVCNGKCVSYCPSGGLRKKEIILLEATCPPGLTPCGVYSNFGTREAWECIDTRNNLESCMSDSITSDQC